MIRVSVLVSETTDELIEKPEQATYTIYVTDGNTTEYLTPISFDKSCEILKDKGRVLIRLKDMNPTPDMLKLIDQAYLEGCAMVCGSRLKL